jgi:hypothetical protein
LRSAMQMCQVEGERERRKNGGEEELREREGV